MTHHINRVRTIAAESIDRWQLLEDFIEEKGHAGELDKWIEEQNRNKLPIGGLRYSPLVGRPEGCGGVPGRKCGE